MKRLVASSLLALMLTGCACVKLVQPDKRHETSVGKCLDEVIEAAVDAARQTAIQAAMGAF